MKPKTLKLKNGYIIEFKKRKGDMPFKGTEIKQLRDFWNWQLKKYSKMLWRMANITVLGIPENKIEMIFDRKTLEFYKKLKKGVSRNE